MEEKQAELFKVLGVESRIRIIDLLKERGPLGVKKMSELLGITPSAVSQHLKTLKHAGLVRNERKGYWIPYRIDPVALARCRSLLSEVCTCGCDGSGPLGDTELSKRGDERAVLREYERELERELQQVRARIRGLKETA
jgi:DNA-binding transcriptional ArsR family regulator